MWCIFLGPRFTFANPPPEAPHKAFRRRGKSGGGHEIRKRRIKVWSSGSQLLFQRNYNIPAIGFAPLDWFFLAVHLHNYLRPVASRNGSILNVKLGDQALSSDLPHAAVVQADRNGAAPVSVVPVCHVPEIVIFGNCEVGILLPGFIDMSGFGQ